MTSAIAFMQNLDAFAFTVLGVAVGVTWVRRRDASAGFLALAIVLLSLVSLLGRLPALFGVSIPLLPQLNLIAFAGSGYALLRYRAAVIPLSARWHAAAGGVLAVTTLAVLVATVAGAPTSFLLWAAVGLLTAWAAVVLESIARSGWARLGCRRFRARRPRPSRPGFPGPC